eukprot:COSAG02_NODE_27108_length_616_cov_3.032882_1_plen_88_part_10
MALCAIPLWIKFQSQLVIVHSVNECGMRQQHCYSECIRYSERSRSRDLSHTCTRTVLDLVVVLLVCRILHVHVVRDIFCRAPLDEHPP